MLMAHSYKRDIAFQVLKSQIFVEKLNESSQNTFLDYLAAGFELNFMAAVDFTGICLNIQKMEHY